MLLSRCMFTSNQSLHADPQPVVRSVLKSKAHSHGNRGLARQLVWNWVRAKWPRLVPSPSELERPDFKCTLPGRSLSFSTKADGSVWTLEVGYVESGSQRAWMTRAIVADTGEADLMALQTSCTNIASAPAVIAPPRLLGAWVERLDLEDGGISVIGEPRPVDDPEGLDAFCEHLHSVNRLLPVIALVNRPNSRYYGVDPRGLSEAVRGLAHVACLAPDIAAEARMRLGKKFGPVPGAARIYAPNFTKEAVPGDHPLIRFPSSSSSDSGNPGAVRRLLCQTVCGMSVRSSEGLDMVIG
jgi:hypothetical protein